jgi:hypothetical protein
VSDPDLGAASRSSDWMRSRYGSHAGRGFRFQDAVAAATATYALVGEDKVEEVIPEGLDDLTVKRSDWTFHAQVKSRRGYLGPFRLTEVAQHLTDLWRRHRHRLRASSRLHLALVLEASVGDLPESGWSRAAGIVEELADPLRAEVSRHGVAAEEVDELLARSHVVVMPAPAAEAVTNLTSHLDVAPAVAQLCYLALLSRVAYLADENGERELENQAVLAAGDVERLLQDTVAVVDLDALEDVLRDGICESVDFMTPLAEPAFHSGVDVAPGHVVAGLTFDRPELVDAVERALHDRRVALVAGPSGSGKSGVIWLTAFDTRHVVRWYRLVRLEHEDVARVLRFVAAMQPTDQARVGLVVDDAGQPGRAGWDLLVEEALRRPGVVVLGAAREEDLASLATYPGTPTIRPKLDSTLAEAIWIALHRSGFTSWADWREPFEASNGLLLEFSHLLTEGERLQETIARQVDRRLREERDLELQVLRVVSAAAVWHGVVNVRVLRQVLGVTEEDLHRALSRLIDEHLVRHVSHEEVGGLHALRSIALARWTHARPPASLETTAEIVLDVVGPLWLPAVISAMVASDDGVPVYRVIERLRARVSNDPSPALLAASLEGLRMAGANAVARRWVDVMDDVGVPAAVREVTANLALIDADVADLDFIPPIKEALARLRGDEMQDLRSTLLEALPDAVINEVIERTSERGLARSLLASAAGTDYQPLVSRLDSIAPIVAEAGLQDASDMLRLARQVDVDMSRRLAASGGTLEERLARTSAELAWIRKLRIESDDAGRMVIAADWLFLDAPGQDDPHGHVVATCRVLAGLFPEGDVFAVRAVDPSGEAAGYGDFRIADKRMERKYLLGNEEVAWNRYRLGLVTFLTGSGPITSRLAEERDLLRETLGVVREAGNAWSVGQQRLPPPLPATLSTIVERATALAPASHHPESPAALGSEAPRPVTGITADVTRMIAGNALPRLFHRGKLNWSLAAFLKDSVLPEAQALVDKEYWRLLSDPPLDAGSELVEAIADLHAILAERLAGNPEAVSALRRAARQDGELALHLAAVEARRRSSARLDSTLARAKAQLSRKGFDVEFARRPPHKPSGLVWPPDDVAVLVEASSTFEWLTPPEEVISACRRTLDSLRDVVLVPIRDGRVIAALGGRLGQNEFFPIPEAVASWSGSLQRPLLYERAATAFRSWLNAVAMQSAIVSSTVSQESAHEELVVVRTMAEERRLAEETLSRFMNEPSGAVVAEVGSVLQSIATEFEAEIAMVAAGTLPQDTIAAKLARASRGTDQELGGTIAACQAALLEWDVDPERAADRVERALDALLDHGGGGADE